MRERGIKPCVANLERVMADLKAGERGGRVPSPMGAPVAGSVNAARAREIQRRARGGGEPV